jgi:prolipoprotein diacylglyceryltransferase
VAVGIALAGGLIRLGNLFNSEILGKPTNLPWAFVFERVDKIPRHPTQIYESLSYFAIFGILYTLYWKKEVVRKSPGYLFGLFLIMVFGVRFVWEFLKENQVAYESALPINMGQALSIPLVLLGIGLVIRARRIASAGN